MNASACIPAPREMAHGRVRENGFTPSLGLRDNDTMSTRNEALPGSFARAGYFFVLPAVRVSQGCEQVAIRQDR